MSEVRIEITDLVVRYAAVPAVNGVSFTVGHGEHVTLLGPSGCGKTTTLRAIAGLEEPSGGTIRLMPGTAAGGKVLRTTQFSAPARPPSICSTTP